MSGSERFGDFKVAWIRLERILDFNLQITSQFGRLASWFWGKRNFSVKDKDARLWLIDEDVPLFQDKMAVKKIFTKFTQRVFCRISPIKEFLWHDWYCRDTSQCLCSNLCLNGDLVKIFLWLSDRFRSKSLVLRNGLTYKTQLRSQIDVLSLLDNAQWTAKCLFLWHKDFHNFWNVANDFSQVKCFHKNFLTDWVIWSAKVFARFGQRFSENTKHRWFHRKYVWQVLGYCCC